MAPNMAAILNDVTGLSAAQQPMICTSSCRAHHRLFIKGGIFSKYSNITKTHGGGEGVHQPPLHHGGGDFLAYGNCVRGTSGSQNRGFDVGQEHLG